MPLSTDSQQIVRIVGQSGNWFLLDVGDGKGRVLDLDNDRVFPPHSLVSLLAKGGWEKPA